MTDIQEYNKQISDEILNLTAISKDKLTDSHESVWNKISTEEERTVRQKLIQEKLIEISEQISNNTLKVAKKYLINTELCYLMKKYSSIRKFKKAVKQGKIELKSGFRRDAANFIIMLKMIKKAKSMEDKKQLKKYIKCTFSGFDDKQFLFVDEHALMQQYNHLTSDFILNNVISPDSALKYYM